MAVDLMSLGLLNGILNIPSVITTILSGVAPDAWRQPCCNACPEIILIFHTAEKRKFQLNRISALRYSASVSSPSSSFSLSHPKVKQNQNQSPGYVAKQGWRRAVFSDWFSIYLRKLKTKKGPRVAGWQNEIVAHTSYSYALQNAGIRAPK